MNTETKTELINGCIERLKNLIPYHVKPYNLGDEGEVLNIIETLIKLAPIAAAQSPKTNSGVTESKTGEGVKEGVEQPFDFNKWILGELEYRKWLLSKENDDYAIKWYVGQIKMLEIVIKQLPGLATPCAAISEGDEVKKLKDIIKQMTCDFAERLQAMDAISEPSEEVDFIDISKVIFHSIDHYREAGKDDSFSVQDIADYLKRIFGYRSRTQKTIE
jgi:hypothetical protein